MEEKDYLSRKACFDEIRDDNQSQLDKIILSLSTGSLALSITFIEKVGRPFNAFSRTLLITCWVLWLLAIIANLSSFSFGIVNMNKKLKDLNERYKSGDDSEEKVFIWRHITEWCNRIAVCSFVVGVICFMIYVGITKLNIKPQENITKVEVIKMPDDQKKATDQSNKIEQRARTESSPPVVTQKQSGNGGSDNKK